MTVSLLHYQWVVETAERRRDRLDAFDEPTNEYAQMARDEYGELVAKYREATMNALESLEDDPDEPT